METLGSMDIRLRVMGLIVILSFEISRQPARFCGFPDHFWKGLLRGFGISGLFVLKALGLQV